MSSQAADLARCLARDAEAVCRQYLSNGRRHGRYWVVGDVTNAPGRSLFVPTGASGPATLARLMERHPLVCVADKAAA